jgi:hypothetical protein
MRKMLRKMLQDVLEFKLIFVEDNVVTSVCYVAAQLCYHLYCKDS